MLTIDDLINQVKQVLIETNDRLSPNQLYSRFVNECDELELSEDDFYKSVVKPAHKSINWEVVEEANKKHDEIKRSENAKLLEKEEEIKNAPAYIIRLINLAIETGIIKTDSLRKIFNKAENLDQDANKLAQQINEKLELAKFRPYPQANLDADTLKEMLLSADWYNEVNYPRPVVQKEKSSKTLGLMLGGVSVLALLLFLVFKNAGGSEEKRDNQYNSPPVDSVSVETPATIINQPVDLPAPVDTAVAAPAAESGTILTTEEQQEISKLLNNFYIADNMEAIDQILDYFVFPIDRYYNAYNIDSDSLRAMFNTAFNTKLLKHSITVNWDETTVDKTTTGYLVSVKAVYLKILQKEPDVEKSMDLKIMIKMNRDKKITTIYAN